MNGRRINVHICCLALIAVLGGSGWGSVARAESQAGNAALVPWPPQKAQLAVKPSQLARALLLPTEPEAWKPAVHKTRGAAQPLYAMIAPATVVVRTPMGHGAGIVVDPSGWILTNYHCVAFASTDLASGAQLVSIHLGNMQDNVMRLEGEAIPALVYKARADKDLALLKLSRLPAGSRTLPHLVLAAAAPSPTDECVVVGHPAAGMLWTVRSCEVANVGAWPEQQIDFVITRLAATSAEDQEKLRQMASRIPPIKIVLSTCGLNPGDSGGPIVNSKGEMIGITFAIPSTDPSSSVSLDKFAYHIHRDEVRDFLAERPASPLLHVPDPWPPAQVSAFLDTDEDGKPDTIGFALGPQGPFTGLVADLDQDCIPGLAAEEMVSDETFRWDLEFAWQPGSDLRAFYDTTGDGEFDLILVDVDRDGVSDLELERQEAAWSRRSTAGRTMKDATLVDASQRARFAAVLRALPE